MNRIYKTTLLKRSTIIVLMSLVSSCATMFNSSRTSVKIHTKLPSTLEVEGEAVVVYPNRVFVDGVEQESKHKAHKIVVKRSEEPLELTISNDTFTKTVSISPKKSFAYWLNTIPWTLGVGFFVDKSQVRRYSYPKKIYILDDTNNVYYDHNPIKEPFNQYSNILKISPVFIFAPINSAIELSYERRTGKRFGTQLSVSYLLPKQFLDVHSNYPSGIKGFRISLEEKIFFKKSSPKGAYFGVEIAYLNNKYRDNASFGEMSSIYDTSYYDNTYGDEFGVRKQTLSFNLKIGYQIIRKRVAFDFSFGIGARYKDIKHFDRLNPDDNMTPPRHINFNYISSLPGKYWAVSIPFNFQIGWRF